MAEMQNNPVVCFRGPANTWGSPPLPSMSASRPAACRMAARWPQIMAATIGNVHVVEEGLSGRTTVYDDPIEGAYKNGARTVLAVIESHAPLDVFVIMLGGAGFKVLFSATAYNSARGVLTLIQMIRGYYALAETSPDILITSRRRRLRTMPSPAFWKARRSPLRRPLTIIWRRSPNAPDVSTSMPTALRMPAPTASISMPRATAPSAWRSAQEVGAIAPDARDRIGPKDGIYIIGMI